MVYRDHESHLKHHHQIIFHQIKMILLKITHSRKLFSSLKHINVEQYYEHQRISKSRVTIHSDKSATMKLPIKTLQGNLVELTEISSNDASSEEKSCNEEAFRVESDDSNIMTVSSSCDEDIAIEGTLGHDVTETNLDDRTYLERKKQEIALISQTILEDPEKHIESINLLWTSMTDRFPLVQKWTLLSLLSIFKDIIPGYRIRPLSDKEKQTEVSKEIQALRLYESRLLKYYQQYLALLEKLIRDERHRYRQLKRKEKTISHKEPSEIVISYEMTLIAIRCQCDLLICAGHFNFNTDLLNSLVVHMNVISPAQIFPWIRHSIEHVLEHDKSGELSLLIVRTIATLLTSKNYRIRPEILEILTNLKFLDDMDSTRGQPQLEPSKRKSNDAYVPKKQRKLLKKDKELMKEMKEAEAELCKQDRQKKVRLSDCCIEEFAYYRPAIPMVISFFSISTYGMFLPLDYPLYPIVIMTISSISDCYLYVLARGNFTSCLYYVFPRSETCEIYSTSSRCFTRSFQVSYNIIGFL